MMGLEDWGLVPMSETGLVLWIAFLVVGYMALKTSLWRDDNGRD